MEILWTMRDSVETAVTLKLFSSLNVASYNHIFNSKLESITMAQCRELDNFNPERLSKEPYPVHDRPRGQADLDSVLRLRQKIRKHGTVDPVWIYQKDDVKILLDGAHRIIAYYLENKRVVPCYIIRVD